MLTTIRLGGATYHVRFLGANTEALLIAAEDRPMRRGSSHDMAFHQIHEDLLAIIGAGTLGVHQPSWTIQDGTACSCGLVVFDGVDPADARGHLDQTRWTSEPVVCSAGCIRSRTCVWPATRAVGAKPRRPWTRRGLRNYTTTVGSAL